MDRKIDISHNTGAADEEAKNIRQSNAHLLHLKCISESQIKPNNLLSPSFFFFWHQGVVAGESVQQSSGRPPLD